MSFREVQRECNDRFIPNERVLEREKGTPCAYVSPALEHDLQTQSVELETGYRTPVTAAVRAAWQDE